MSVYQWWKALAIVGTILNACWVAALAIPASTLRYFVTCKLHIPGNLQGLIFLGAFVLTLPISLTFATDAARNERLSWSQRVPWVLGLMLASLVAIPRYWWQFMRDPRQPR